jgi:hypothetical protein
MNYVAYCSVYSHPPFRFRPGEPEMQNRERIRWTSHRLRRILLVLALAMPVVNAVAWIYINDIPEIMHRNMLPYFAIVPLPASARLMGFLVTMLPTAVAMSGAYYLMQLFHLYEQGQIFRPSNVQCFKRLSRVLIWWFAAGIIHRSLLSVALTLHHPPGHRIITLGIGSPDLTALLLGAILAVIAWVMEEGCKLQEDQDFTV